MRHLFYLVLLFRGALWTGINQHNKFHLEQGTWGESASTPYNKLGYGFGNGGSGGYSWGFTSADQIAANTAVLVTLRRVAGQAYDEIYVNGTLAAVTQSQSGATGAHVNAHPTSLGRMGPLAITPFDGYIFHIKIHNSALSTADREAVEADLMTKWGL